MSTMDNLRHQVVMTWLATRMKILDQSPEIRVLLALSLALMPAALLIAVGLVAEPIMGWIAEPLAECWEVRPEDVRCFKE